jgi:hypothetical protein
MLATLRWPEWRYEVIAAANAVFCVNSFFMLIKYKHEGKAARRRGPAA